MAVAVGTLKIAVAAGTDLAVAVVVAVDIQSPEAAFHQQLDIQYTAVEVEPGHILVAERHIEVVGPGRIVAGRSQVDPGER